jgi:hypothetical protein
VIEHVLGGLAEVDNPLAHVGWLHAERHVLRVDRTRTVVVTADPADATRDEMSVAGILALHEDAVAAEDRRRAMALDDLLLLKIDFRVDAETTDYASDRVP